MAQTTVPRRVRFGVFEADLRTGELHKAGAKVRLSGQPFDVLTLLLERPGDVVTREELKERLWPKDVFVDFDQSLNKAVNKIREAIGDDADSPRFVETLPRRGYRFIAPVATVEAPSSAAAAALAGPAAKPPSRVPPALLAVGLVALGLALALLWSRRSAPPAGRVRLLVLPFENLSGPEGDYFSDGLTEEMIAQVGTLDPARLGVIARTSAMHYKGTRKPADQIARELGVDYIVEGSVRREGERVRITAQLIETRTQTHLWAESYDREAAGVLGIQGEVARRIADSLALELLPERRGALGEPGTRSSAAHDAYLRGRFLWNKRTDEGLRRSLAAFEEAVLADPGYAPAFAGLADAWNVLADYALVPPVEAAPKAEAAARRALSLKPDLAEAHAAHAYTRWNFYWDAKGAEQAFSRALELRPGYAAARQWYGTYLGQVGRFAEAREQVARAQELDPLSLIIRTNAGALSYFERDFEAAAAASRKTLALDPEFPVALWVLGLAEEGAGRFEAAVAAFERAVTASSGNPTYRAARGHALARRGQTAEARAVLLELSALRRSSYVSPFDLALLHAGLGETSAALDSLEECYLKRSSAVADLAVDPRLDPLRGEPRFQALLARAGLPPVPSGRPPSAP
jgi:TolB-like protein/DNA-binding winged helix-turn-helix (wHTH) protein/Flp pilus assembly protein TadD